MTRAIIESPQVSGVSKKKTYRPAAVAAHQTTLLSVSLWAARRQSARWHAAIDFAGVAVGAREREAPQLADGPSVRSAVKRKRKIHYSQASDWLDKAVSVADKATPLLRYFYILGHLHRADILYRISCTHPIRYSLAFTDRVIICNGMVREQSSTPLSEYCCYVSTAWTHACQRQYGLLTVLIDWDRYWYQHSTSP